VPKFVADSSVSPQGLKWAVDPVADVITTAGDLIYGTAADTVARLGIGTAGQVLKVNSGATAPEWGTVGGGGKVLQVVTATTTTSTAISGSSYGDSGLSASITPSSASSKVMILTMQQVYIQRTNENRYSNFRLVRTSTEISGTRGGMFGTSGIYYMSPNFVYLDSPATTSATTYKTQGKGDGADATTTFQFDNNSTTMGTIILLEIGA
jgi:hypothetical protein